MSSYTHRSPVLLAAGQHFDWKDLLQFVYDYATEFHQIGYGEPTACCMDAAIATYVKTHNKEKEEPNA